jgi:DDE superfamily endonuclease
VHYLAGYIVGRQQVSEFYTQLDHAYPAVDLLYVIQDNWNIHTHPDVLEALAAHPRIKPVWLPTYAPWLNPIEERPRDYPWSAPQAQQRARNSSAPPLNRPDGRGGPPLSSQGRPIVLGHSAP